MRVSDNSRRNWQPAEWAAGIIHAAASLRRRATVLASAIRLPSYKSHFPPSHQGAYQRAGYKPVPWSVLRVLKVVSVARALKRSALNQSASNVFAAISFRYTRGPAVRTTTQVSSGLARAIRQRLGRIAQESKITQAAVNPGVWKCCGRGS
jgi:hypothetical protein